MSQSLDNKNNFKTLVRKKATKWPTKKGFKEIEWLRAWEISSNNTDEDVMIYDAGIVFDRILSELRKEISGLYKTPPNVKTSQLIRAYCGMANRDMAITVTSNIEKGADLTSLTSFSNKFRNELSHQEIADGCVDAIECAIRSYQKRPTTPTLDGGQMDAFSFMKRELVISQLYGAYEDYWLALVWGDFHFINIGSNNDEYEIRQIASDLVISNETSQIRKQKLAAQALTIVTNDAILNLLKDKGCIDIKRDGKKIKIMAKKVAQLAHEYQIVNALFSAQAFFSQDQFPSRFLNSEFNDCGFTLTDVLEVFRTLTILSQISVDKFPQDDSVFSFKKAISFCPKVDRGELIRGITKATNFDFDKCSKIIDFLTFKGEFDEDLWCHPIINLDNNDVTFLLASLNSPIIQRCIEHWLVNLKVDLGDKGLSYEKVVLDSINEELKNNPIFHDYELAVSRRIKLADDCEEEIDLIFRFGRIIIVGEVKSIVTTDSSISLYRTNEIILGAAEQAERKKQFVSENIASVFTKLGWTYSDELEYKLLPLILTSNSICVGRTVAEVPICDLKILSKYFQDKIVPLVSKSENQHLAWFELYNDFVEAQSNIEKYLHNPPQLTLSRDDFKFVSGLMPTVSANSPKIKFTRLVNKPANIDDLINKAYSFPVCLSPNFKNETSNFDYII